jgi:hypothetical protein
MMMVRNISSDDIQVAKIMRTRFPCEFATTFRDTHATRYGRVRGCPASFDGGYLASCHVKLELKENPRETQGLIMCKVVREQQCNSATALISTKQNSEQRDLQESTQRVASWMVRETSAGNQPIAKWLWLVLLAKLSLTSHHATELTICGVIGSPDPKGKKKNEKKKILEPHMTTPLLLDAVLELTTLRNLGHHR